MANTNLTLTVELIEPDRELLRRTCENLEWYREHLKGQAVKQVEQEAQRLAEKEAKVELSASEVKAP